MDASIEELVQNTDAVFRYKPAERRQRPVIVCLCGSTKFKKEFEEEMARLTLHGRIVISVGLFGHSDFPNYNWETDVTEVKKRVDGIHLFKIDMADQIHVINPGGYIGESTKREIEYASKQGKIITYLDFASGGE